MRNTALLAWLWLMSAAMCALSATPPRIDYNRDVLPILSRNCFACHGPDEKARQAGLRLDTREGIERAKTSVIKAGAKGASELVRRITDRSSDERMPPAESNRQLSESEIGVLGRWVDEGASWSGHWAFQKIERPALPAARQRTWVRNSIDDFILSRLEREGLTPSPACGKETLLRRVTFDLTGLPPALHETEAFLADQSEAAYDRVLDRLFASPSYGERWARHWLDAARYADSTGFETDAPREIWMYRDWVIAALNRDLPFDQFIVEQLAGDLLPNAISDKRVATGFLLCGPQDGGSEPSRLDAVVDRVNTIGTVLLGLTLACAQCHNHKFDPISQREYYGLFAFVNASDETALEFAEPEMLARRDALRSQLAALTGERDAYAAKLGAGLSATDPGLLERNRTIDDLKKRVPKLDSTPVLTVPPSPRATTMFIRGEFSRPGESVSPGVPAVLPVISPAATGPLTRLDFARWLVSPEQPLTARVTVNRIWQQFFGSGLVETENDFGTQGARPSHPELLDWLATEFMSQGWSMKALHRLVVSSATYRQSSRRRAELDAVDAQNRLLARQSRLRLEAEAIRDAALAVSGLFAEKLGGPSVFPFQHEGVMLNRTTPAPWVVSAGADRYRRGLYTHYWRLTPHPTLQTFDAPDSLTACTRRRPTNTPLQALALLNDPMFVECADVLARRVMREASSDEQRLVRAFRLCLGRTPTADERSVLKSVLSAARKRSAADAMATSDNTQKVPDGFELAAWTQVVRTLINLDEFINRE